MMAPDDRRPIDPLDAGDPALKAWEEFRAAYASALLMHRFLNDLDQLLPDYLFDLWNRLETGFGYKERLEADGIYDGAVPIHKPQSWDGVDFWIDYEDLELLYESLFPHGPVSDPPGAIWRSTVVVPMHGALEAYAVSVGVTARGNLVRNIRAFLRTRGSEALLDATTCDDIVDLDATRHVWVHNGGVVDEGFIRAVHNSPFQIGERRTLAAKDIDRFDRAVRRTAALLRRVSQLSS